MQTFAETGTHRLMMKWDHYFPIYERHFAQYHERPIRMLEIGVFHGGSLDLWRHAFGPDAVIVGIDVFPDVLQYAGPNTYIELCDQGNREKLDALAAKYGPFDIILDDGGHHMQQQICSLETLFPHLTPNGVYVVEDTHTSYWSEFGGGFRKPGSFIEFAKSIADYTHSDSFRQTDPTGWNSQFKKALTDRLTSVSFYDSVVVLQSGDKPPRKAMHYFGDGTFRHVGSSRS